MTEYTVTKAKSEKNDKKSEKKRGRSQILTEYTMTKLNLKLVQKYDGLYTKTKILTKKSEKKGAESKYDGIY